MLGIRPKRHLGCFQEKINRDSSLKKINQRGIKHLEIENNQWVHSPPPQLVYVVHNSITMSDNQKIDLSTLNHDQFITLMYKMWLEHGAKYCNSYTNNISWKINELPRGKIAKYILKIMQHLGVDLDGLRDLVSKTSVASMCSDEGAISSLSLFIGFGHNKSNKGIVKKVNRHIHHSNRELQTTQED